MTKSYQVVQDRYERGYDEPTRDEYPILFATVDEARARVKRDGLAAMFEHEGDSHYIIELEPFRDRWHGDGVIATGRTFELGPDPDAIPAHITDPKDDGSCDPLRGRRMDSADCGEN
jgi:hypothetical protein